MITGFLPFGDELDDPMEVYLTIMNTFIFKQKTETSKICERQKFD